MSKHRAAANPSVPEFDRTGVMFLLTELETALTFLTLADGSKDPETVSRNHKNALTAYRTFLRLRNGVKPNVREQQAMDDKLGLLKERLQAAGII